MATLTIKQAYNRYEEIMSSKLEPVRKDKALAALMTELEHAYGIPALRNEAWEAEHRSVIALYRMISESRVTL